MFAGGEIGALCEWAGRVRPVSMTSDETFAQLGLGAVAGLAGTLLLHAAMTARGKAAPSSVPAIRRDPAEFFVERGKRQLPARVQERIPESVGKAVGMGLASGYGVLFGAIYGLVRRNRVTVPRAMMEGSLLGVIAWAVGYLGWLPAGGFMPPLWKQKWPATVGPLVDHALYGAATAGALDVMMRVRG